ncbi:MAG: zinc ribbon domain-containing protein [Planctomycetaceae bacterium]
MEQTTTRMDTIAKLLKLQEMDRERDKLQRRLDQVPVLLKAHSDAVAAAEGALHEQESLLRTIRAEVDRNELEIATRQAEREKVRGSMNQPRITAREYTILQEQLAGCLADIDSYTERGLAGIDRAKEAEGKLGELRAALDASRAAHEQARAELEGSLAGVRAQLAERTAARNEFSSGVPKESLEIYDRIHAGLRGGAMAAVEGTIDRAAGRIGNDLHCSACHMSVTPNDAVHILARHKVLQCRSCMRILYVP